MHFFVTTLILMNFSKCNQVNMSLLGCIFFFFEIFGFLPNFLCCGFELFLTLIHVFFWIERVDYTTKLLLKFCPTKSPLIKDFFCVNNICYISLIMSSKLTNQGKNLLYKIFQKIKILKKVFFSNLFTRIWYTNMCLSLYKQFLSDS